MEPIEINLQMLQFLGLLIPGLVIAKQFLPSDGESMGNFPSEITLLKREVVDGKLYPVGPDVDEEDAEPHVKEVHYGVSQSGFYYLLSLGCLVAASVLLIANLVIFIVTGFATRTLLLVSTVVLLLGLLFLLVYFIVLSIDAIELV